MILIFMDWFNNCQTIFTVTITDVRFERYKNNTSAERGAVKSPVSSDDAFSPDEVMVMVIFSIALGGMIMIIKNDRPGDDGTLRSM